MSRDNPVHSPSFGSPVPPALPPPQGKSQTRAPIQPKASARAQTDAPDSDVVITKNLMGRALPPAPEALAKPPATDTDAGISPWLETDPTAVGAEPLPIFEEPTGIDLVAPAPVPARPNAFTYSPEPQEPVTPTAITAAPTTASPAAAQGPALRALGIFARRLSIPLGAALLALFATGLIGALLGRVIGNPSATEFANDGPKSQPEPLLAEPGTLPKSTLAPTAPAPAVTPLEPLAPEATAADDTAVEGTVKRNSPPATPAVPQNNARPRPNKLRANNPVKTKTMSSVRNPVTKR